MSFPCCTALTVLALITGAAYGRPAEPRPVKDPAALVRRAVANELKSSANDPKMAFRVRKKTAAGTQTRQYVETNEGTAGMLVAVNDQPLSPADRQQEFTKLEQVLNNPRELRHKQRQQKEDSARVSRMLQALPDAFLYKYAGTEKAGNGDPLVRLSFSPNPNYNPPSHEQQVFTGMNGFLLIDERRERIARIDGTLFRDVGFGWGILGHLDQGGRFVVEQGDVGNGLWETTHMQLSFTGKALLFKKLDIQSDESSSDFRPIADKLTFAQGVELLKKQDRAVAKNGGAKQNP
jgi:hypothetical protein